MMCANYILDTSYNSNDLQHRAANVDNNKRIDIVDVIKISKGTTNQDELFEYVEAPDYYKERVGDYDECEYDKDDFDLSR